MSQQRDIDSLLDGVVSLPSLPTSVARIVEVVNDPQCSLVEVGRVVSTDPSIALKTLRLTNSAYYGLRQKVTSVEQAVVLLGLKVVKNMVFTATVFDSLRTGMQDFLHHSVSCGVAMRVLAEEAKASLPFSSPDEAFVYGLLHDVGKIIFEQFLPREYALVADAAQAGEQAWFEAEREVFGTDHAEMGARLAEKWKLPDDLVGAIAGHHDLKRCPPEHVTLASLLSIADFICCASGFGGHPDEIAKVSEAHWTTSRIASRQVPSIMDRFYEAVPHIKELVAIAAG